MSNQFISADEQDKSQLKKNGLGDIKSFIFLLKYLRGDWGRFILCISLFLFAALLSIFSARLMGSFVEDAAMKFDYSLAIKIGGSIVLLEFLDLFFKWYAKKGLIDISSNAVLNIRSALLNHLQLLPMGFYDKQPQGRIVTRVTHDVETVEEFFSSSMGRLISSIFLAITSATAMCITNFKIGLILVVSMLPTVLFVYFTKKKVRHLNREVSKTSSNINSKLSEFISGISVIRLFGMEKWSEIEFVKTIDNYLEVQLKANSLYAITRPITSFLCTLPLIGLVWFGGREVIEGTMSVGIFVAFIRYCEKFYTPILMLSNEIHKLQAAFSNSERIVSFLNHETEDDLFSGDGSISIKDHIFKGEIEFKNIWMSYNNNDWVLKDVSFKIGSGQKIGLVGTTGSGKTTTISLLSRLYDYSKGEIFIDGNELRSYKRSFLRSHIGLVGQDPVLIKGTLRENIVLNFSHSDEEVWDCIYKTGLDKVLRENSMTLDSIILEDGANLSIGEKQLVSLTRVLLKNPEVLILDEATANIDPHFEKIIHDAVNIIMEGRTCLIIAHRLDTIKSCDSILVFDKGELIESGSIDTLLEKKGRFYGLHKAVEKSI